METSIHNVTDLRPLRAPVRRERRGSDAPGFRRALKDPADTSGAGKHEAESQEHRRRAQPADGGETGGRLDVLG